MVLKQVDASYAALLLEESEQLYAFGKRYQGGWDGRCCWQHV